MISLDLALSEAHSGLRMLARHLYECPRNCVGSQDTVTFDLERIVAAEKVLAGSCAPLLQEHQAAATQLEAAVQQRAQGEETAQALEEELAATMQACMQSQRCDGVEGSMMFACMFQTSAGSKASLHTKAAR